MVSVQSFLPWTCSLCSCWTCRSHVWLPSEDTTSTSLLNVNFNVCQEEYIFRLTVQLSGAWIQPTHPPKRGVVKQRCFAQCIFFFLKKQWSKWRPVLSERSADTFALNNLFLILIFIGRFSDNIVFRRVGLLLADFRTILFSDVSVYLLLANFRTILFSDMSVYLFIYLFIYFFFCFCFFLFFCFFVCL